MILDDLRPEIERLLRETGQGILGVSDIESLIRSMKKAPKVAKTINAKDIEEFLVSRGMLQRIVFPFPSGMQVRYALPTKSIYEVVQTLRPSSYFTHLSALGINKLIDDSRNTVYLNWEQKSKSILASELSQERIRNAFARPQRVPKQGVAVVRGLKIYLLNGRNTGQLGVISTNSPEWGVARVTDVERTLIDSTVRPEYAGGVKTVLEAFRRAKRENKVSEDKLINYLKTLSYIYPYHQSIGFYMERSGIFDPDSIQLLQAMPIVYDFYLAYRMRDVEYSSRWRLFYPKDL